MNRQDKISSPLLLTFLCKYFDNEFSHLQAFCCSLYYDVNDIGMHSIKFPLDDMKFVPRLKIIKKDYFGNSNLLCMKWSKLYFKSILLCHEFNLFSFKYQCFFGHNKKKLRKIRLHIIQSFGPSLFTCLFLQVSRVQQSNNKLTITFHTFKKNPTVLSFFINSLKKNKFKKFKRLNYKKPYPIDKLFFFDQMTEKSIFYNSKQLIICNVHHVYKRPSFVFIFFCTLAEEYIEEGVIPYCVKLAC
ncbi:hypothetical protein RFI_40365 [Reticulomyxa filosa]|uniref:Uncharacterized protein n=1 Tax=Reticulomyxa filosa TaxID=46433 RepID=X6L7B4_RETFI|nr:hypothetical protein RFI_40365 [Reticulomyxa filosa]|eukprot:ETN97168.1 hypothetical protein RFI_40365 [Reticulomyxa filosa]